MLAERGGDRGAALACNSVDGERHAAGSDCCPDPVERAVFIYDHEVTANGLQLGDELRATREIDRLIPRALAIAINDLPTPEFAAFWTTQSPGLRSDASSRSRNGRG